MRLSDALRLDEVPCLALVGAGGKTSALFQLGREFKRQTASSKIILTATTHLANDQVSWADHHFVVQHLVDLDKLAGNLPEGLLVLTGPQEDADRTAGLDENIINQLHKLAQHEHVPLFIEADGSRQRPLKAPADHEPVIPEWVQEVVVVAGLSGLGKAIGGDWVHRLEHFSMLAGLAPGDLITLPAIARVLKNENGGMKNIPSQARRMVLLNQASTPERAAAANRLAALLLPDYPAVVVSDLPHQCPPAGEVDGTSILAVHEPVAGIILAAGSSSRFGQPKQILPWRGLPLVRHVAINALGAGLAPVIVVIGYAAAQVGAALADLQVQIVHNPDWVAGQSTSLKAGLRALPMETGGALFMLADQPMTPRSLIRALVESHAANLAPVTGPLLDGKRGNPVLFDRSTFPDLLNLHGDTGGREIFSKYPVKWMDWYDSDVGMDVDTPQDYKDLLDLAF